MQTVKRGDPPPTPVAASLPSPAEQRAIAIQVVRKALATSPAAVAEELGMPLDHMSRALARAVAEYNMVTAGLIEPEQGARLGSEGLAASIRMAGFRVVASPRTARADCRKGAEMAEVQARLKAVEPCNSRHGALNA